MAVGNEHRKDPCHDQLPFLAGEGEGGDVVDDLKQTESRLAGCRRRLGGGK